MRSVVADIRSWDAADKRRLADKRLTEKAETEPPSYESLFPTSNANDAVPCSQLPPSSSKLTESLQGNESESGSQNSIVTQAAKLDLDRDYDPSMWYYESGPNPIPYDMGRKVTSPFTSSLQTLLSVGDKKKLKEISLRSFQKYVNSF